MKQIYIETNNQKKSQLGLQVELAVRNHLIKLRDDKLTGENIFLDQNMGKGPPGQSVCLEVEVSIVPGNHPAFERVAFKSSPSVGQLNKLQLFNHLIINKQQLLHSFLNL